MKKYLLLALCWVMVQGATAQTTAIKFEPVAGSNPLSQTTITTILQDQKGFMWFGSTNGLHRFDGFSFKSYQYDPEARNGLQGTTVSCLYQDKAGKLWIGTVENGLNCLDLVTGHFTHYAHQAADAKSLGGDQVMGIAEDAEGFLWIATGASGLSRLDKARGTFTRYKHQANNPGSISSDMIGSVYVDRSGTVWAGTSRAGLNRFDRKTGRFIRYENKTANEQSLLHNSAWTIYEDKGGKLWIAGIGGNMHLFDRKTGQFQRFPNTVNEANVSDGLNVAMAISEDPTGRYWVATLNNGLQQFDPLTHRYTPYKHQPDNPASIGDNTINTVYTDRSGVVWVGTYSAGIYKINQLGSRFQHYQMQSEAAKGLSSNSISGVCESRSGTWWVGTIDGGLNKIDRQTGIITWYQHQSGNTNSLSSNTVRCVYEDHTGMLWVGTINNGLNQLDPATGRVKRYQAQTDTTTGLNDNIVLCVYEDQAHSLWIGTGSGLTQFDRTTGRFIHYTKLSANAAAGAEFVNCIWEDPTGLLWLGTSNGIKQFNPRTRKFTAYTGSTKASRNTIDSEVNTLYQSHSGYLWAGSNDGLFQINLKTNAMIRYSVKDGLPSETITGILEDDQANFWLSTTGGLSKFTPATGKFRNYNAWDGLQSTEFTVASSWKSKTGELLFGGTKGLDVFQPTQLRDNVHVPTLVLTDFQVFNQSVPVQNSSAQADNPLMLPQSITEVSAITLPYWANVFSFEFAALDYTQPEKNQYAYQMEGFEKDWVYSGSRRFVTYTNLDPGTYTFRVKGSNNDGIWNPAGRILKVTILPPWWRTWWAYGLYALLGVGALYLFRHYTLTRERLKSDLRVKSLESQKLQEVDQMKTRFFTNISHEFRTPLTLILGPVEEMLDTTPMTSANQPKLKLVHRNARRLLELINQLLDLARLDAGRLRLQAQAGNLVTTVRTAVAAFETLANQRQIELQFSSSADAIEAYFDRDKLETVLYNLLSNAFKFTPEGGFISVSVSTPTNEPGIPRKTKHAQYATILVEDSGQGIAAHQLAHIFDRFYQADHSTFVEQEGSGIGLALTRELVHLHEGEIYVNSQPGEGTSFAVFLPMGHAHLKADQLRTDESVVPSYPALKPELSPTTNGIQAETVYATTTTQPDLPLVLLVEDNADMRTYLQSSLGGGYRVVTAPNGAEGVHQATQLIPDLVVSDVMMPQMDGFQLCQHLKTDERTSHIPVILLTAQAGRESKLSGLETGADDYLVKPFDAEELRVRVRNLILQRQKLRERFAGEIKLPPTEVAPPSADDLFLKKVMEVVEINMSNPDFNVDKLSREIGMSQSQLYRKITALTGINSSEFIRRLRLQRAAALLAAGRGNVTEVSYEVGFNNLSYFAKCFKELYGQSPSEYAAHPIKAD
jgi:signal transduction histidine kinase/ligand-binding sensor domain-containing protein/DNA-binding response OmpR family regulator